MDRDLLLEATGTLYSETVSFYRWIKFRCSKCGHPMRLTFGPGQVIGDPAVIERLQSERDKEMAAEIDTAVPKLGDEWAGERIKQVPWRDELTADEHAYLQRARLMGKATESVNYWGGIDFEKLRQDVEDMDAGIVKCRLGNPDRHWSKELGCYVSEVHPNYIGNYVERGVKPYGPYNCSRIVNGMVIACNEEGDLLYWPPGAPYGGTP